MEQQEVLQYKVSGKPRAFRLLFLVEQGYDINGLKELLLKNLQVWGGRHNPIIPVLNGKLSEQWENFFGVQDPDYIYITPGVGFNDAKILCDKHGLNPIEIIVVPKIMGDIKAVHYANLLPVLSPKVLLQPVNLWEVDSPLLDYYKLNFLLDLTMPVTRGLFKNHQLIPVYQKNFENINELIGRPFVNSNTLLSAENTNVSKLRPAHAEHHSLELVVAADEGGFEELIYHWNKPAYALTNREVFTIYVTKSELELLVADKYFKDALHKLAEDSSKIHLVSFTLTMSQLEELRVKLTLSCTANRFEIKQVLEFPYRFIDTRTNFQETNAEKENIQVIFKNQNFVFFPPLSFELAHRPFFQAYTVDLKINELHGPFNQTLRFPQKCITDVITQTPGRVNKSRQISVELNDAILEQESLKLCLPTLYDIIGQVVTTPKITGTRDFKNINQRISYSDSSNKLAQFFSLFNHDLQMVEDFLQDKFWSDLLTTLTSNRKVEGDTITFNELFARCFALMQQEGIVFTKKEEGKYYPENLKVGLIRMIQPLTEQMIFLTGYNVKCTACSLKIWYSLSEINNTVTCKGCGKVNYFPTENPISYKLNQLIKNNIGTLDVTTGKFSDNGNMTAVRTLLHIRQSALNGFSFIPQIDIYGCPTKEKPKTDLDIVAMSMGKLIIGECKHSSAFFAQDKHKSLDNLLEISATMRPDCMIISCTIDENGKLEKAAEYLRHKMKIWSRPIEVITYQTWEPTYFGRSKESYFPLLR